MKKVTLIGDCIRRDYQPIVRDELEDVAEVWGPKETIKTTRDVLAHLDEWVLGPRLDLFHFNCGLHEIRRFRPGDPPQGDGTVAGVQTALNFNTSIHHIHIDTVLVSCRGR